MAFLSTQEDTVLHSHFPSHTETRGRIMPPVSLPHAEYGAGLVPSGSLHGGLDRTLVTSLVHEATGKDFSILHVTKPRFQAPFSARFYRAMHTY